MSEASGSDETLDAVGEATSSVSAAVEGHGRGDVVGRYVILSTLGAGGMGVVYAAYDPELDRNVALKVLRPELAGRGSGGATRLLREAQALGRLNHPNVVTVHDVSTHEGEVWIAMEFVAGRTLGAWSKERRRTWREVLAVMRKVAQGLAAAHGAGLVHRDVKPDNVMLGDDGRVRVMDFGLARGTESLSDGAPEQAVSARPGRRELDAAVTRAGAIAGTPAYMAPEQLTGAAADARTDQFAYCVMLWELVYGERPFGGESLLALATNILEGERRPPPEDVRVPRWVKTVLHRGLAIEPDARWPSLDALVGALDRGERRALRWKTVAVAGGLAAISGAALGVRRWDEHQRIAACERTGEEIDALWNDDERQAVRTGLVSAGGSGGEVAADKVMPWLDAQAVAWRIARVDACIDAEVRRSWNADLLDRSVWCLDERYLELQELVAALKDANENAVLAAVPTASSLRRIDACRDEALLLRVPTPPAEVRDEVRSVRAELSRAGALHVTGDYEVGLGVARGALERSRAIGFAPLTAAAVLEVGRTLERSGAYAEAESKLEEAYFVASTAGALEEALDAAMRLGFLVGYTLARPVEGERWVRHADVMRSMLPDPHGLREAASLSYLGHMRWSTNAFEEAATLYRRALAIRETALGLDHPFVADALESLAAVHWSAGEFAEARALQQRALKIKEKTLGAEHPDVAHILDNLGVTVRLETGNLDEAAALHERALAIEERVYGPDHPAVADTLDNLANLRFQAGAYEEAGRLFERELAIRTRTVGAQHPSTATALSNAARVRLAMGAHAEAARLYEQALAIRMHALGPEHLDVAQSLEGLAVVREAAGAYEEAAELHERALAIVEPKLGPDHPRVARTLSNLGIIRDKAGAHAEASALHERAVAINEKVLGPDHPDLASSLEALAVGREATGNIDEASSLHARALSIFEATLGPEHPRVADPLIGLARVALLEGRGVDAVGLAERALTIWDTGGAPAIEIAEARLVLAEALLAAGESKSRATELATSARDVFRNAGDAHQRRLSDAETILHRHHGRSRRDSAPDADAPSD